MTELCEFTVHSQHKSPKVGVRMREGQSPGIADLLAVSIPE